MIPHAIDVTGAHRSFGTVRAISDISLSATEGERILLLGHNGSGKSTLLAICSGVLRCTSGSAMIAGASPRHSKVTGYAGHTPMIYSALTARENLEIFAAFSCVKPSSVDASLVHWGLADVADRPSQTLSKGLQARLSLARATIHSPAVLLLDEPTASLDDAGASLLSTYILSRTDMACIIATHDIARLRPVATRIVVLESGAVIADSARSSLDEAIVIYRERNR